MITNKNRDLTQLWFCKVRRNCTSNQRWVAQLTPSQRSRHQQLKTLVQKDEFITSRALLHHALTANCSSSANGNWQIQERHKNSPLVTPMPSNLSHVAISHSQGLVVLALSQQKLNIDIQYWRSAKAPIALAQRLFPDKLIEKIHKEAKEDQAKRIYDLFSQKEALYKLLFHGPHKFNFANRNVQIPHTIQCVNCCSLNKISLSLVSDKVLTTPQCFWAIPGKKTRKLQLKFEKCIDHLALV